MRREGKGGCNRQMGGFTLPTVVTISIIMLAILATVLQLLSSSRMALANQYYDQLAREAAEAGGVYIAECVRLGNFDTSVTLTPETSCLGSVVSTQVDHLVKTSRYKSTFTAQYQLDGEVKQTKVEGTVSLLRPSGEVQKTYSHTLKQQHVREIDTAASRASKRWWYFGNNSKLDFGIKGNSVPVSSAMGGEASGTIMHEGVTAVSDRDGNIKFHSDGRSIWDRNGNLMPVLAGSSNPFPNCDMPAGTTFPFAPGGQGLCGSLTATQAVVAFPIDKAETRYIVVTNTANAVGIKYGTLYFTIVDFRNPSLPNGQIILRNTSMGAPPAATASAPASYPVSPYAAEALNARPNAEGNGAIVYTYRPSAKNVLFAFPVYSLNEGMHIQRPAPAYFEITGLTAQACGNTSEDFRKTGFGSINFNHDYTRMIVYMGGTNSCKSSQARAGTLYLFDISGGDLSMNLLASWYAYIGQGGAYGYSADFSPSGRYVYATKIYTGELFRYDVSSGNSTTIKNSQQFIGYTGCEYHWYVTGGADGTCSKNPDFTPRMVNGSYPYTDPVGRPGNGGGQVLRGPDGRMYVADRGANHVSVIHNPDATSIANIGWEYGGIKLAPGTVSMYGLPQMVTMYSPQTWRF